MLLILFIYSGEDGRGQCKEVNWHKSFEPNHIRHVSTQHTLLWEPIWCIWCFCSDPWWQGTFFPDTDTWQEDEPLPSRDCFGYPSWCCPWCCSWRKDGKNRVDATSGQPWAPSEKDLRGWTKLLHFCTVGFYMGSRILCKQQAEPGIREKLELT